MRKSNKLESITSEYSKRKNDYSSVGQYFAFWGLWLTLTCIVVYLTGFHSIWFFSTIAGVIVQYAATKYLVKKHGFVFKQSLTISALWIFLALSTIIFFFVMPAVLKVYSHKYILHFISIEMFMGLVITAAYLRSLPFFAGALVYFFTGIFFKHFENRTEVIYFSIQFMSGFFLPGIWSMYESRNKKI
ncbi:MAG: hypothetical protein KA015_04090 [Spirochaetes bacterium]|nr:hypothetical protein [Spirochaetota bacterium]